MKKHVIISGGPGSGKTTILGLLKKHHFKTYKEVPRILIENQLDREKPVLPWTDLSSFAEMCFKMMLNQKKDAEKYDLVFFDRAIGDILAYMNIGGLNPLSEYINEAEKDYYNIVFLFKPHKNLYFSDRIRPHSFNEALDIHKEIKMIYSNLGYEIEEIPFCSLENQIEIISIKLQL